MEDTIGPSPIPSPMPEKKDIKSILVQIATPIVGARTLAQAQQIILDFINTYKISKGGEEYKVLAGIAQNTSLGSLIRHFYNSLLKFEGMSTRE